jgi:threonine aldolase
MSKDMFINLISDTVTKPTQEMLEFMFSAEVGDDVFGEDPTVNKLENKAAAMFGKEAALFCPSGTMTNQLAIKINTQPLEEVICDNTAHIYQYEAGAYAFHSGVAVNPIPSDDGKLKPEIVDNQVKTTYDWLPHTKMLAIENSCNRAGGNFYTLGEMSALEKIARKHHLIYHLDGARIFNVIAETGITTESVGGLFDTISVCLSKGLGAPVGSLLLGTKEKIKSARRYRKAFGGGMRQAGYLAAAGIYALDHHVSRLKEDHAKANFIASVLQSLNWVKDIKPVKTNIIIFQTADDLPAIEVVNLLKAKNINCSAFGQNLIRFVFHLDIKDQMMPVLEQNLKSIR